MEKEIRDRKLLNLEVVILVFAIAVFISLTFVACFVNMETWLKILLISIGVVEVIIAGGFALKIEQIAGFYVCKKCGQKHVPSYDQVLLAPHIYRMRYLKCPHCGQRSWNKKVVK